MANRIMSGRQYHQGGFTLMGVLIMIMVMGISLAGASNYWTTILRREKEAELLFRGDQIRKAIQSYCQQAPSGKQIKYPSSLQDLIQDPRFLTIKRHLRRLYKDPMTKDGNWAIVMSEDGGIKGVHSRSSRKPIKTGNFDRDYQDFNMAKTYMDWNFIYEIKDKGKK